MARNTPLTVLSGEPEEGWGSKIALGRQQHMMESAKLNPCLGGVRTAHPLSCNGSSWLQRRSEHICQREEVCSGRRCSARPGQTDAALSLPASSSFPCLPSPPKSLGLGLPFVTLPASVSFSSLDSIQFWNIAQCSGHGTV